VAGRKLAISKAIERGLTAPEKEVAQFKPDWDDRLILEAMLNRAMRHEDIAKMTGIPEPEVTKRLLDPVRCAYLSQQAVQVVQQRGGLVTAAVYAKAIQTGDPAAARLVLQQLGELVPEEARVEHRHSHAHLHFTEMSDEQLSTFIAEKERELGRVHDVEVEVKEQTHEGVRDDEVPGVPDGGDSGDHDQ